MVQKSIEFLLENFLSFVVEDSWRREKDKAKESKKRENNN